jgi:bla regulator protein blaR1
MSGAAVLANVGAYSLQVGLLAVAGALVAWAMRLRAPGAMLAYWQALLAACLLLPVLQPWSPLATGSGLVSWQTTAAPASASGSPLLLGRALALALVAGSLLRAGWLVLGWRRLARCRAQARPLGVLPHAVADLPQRLGVRASFYVSPEIDAPAAFGLRRPVVLLPASFLSMGPAAQRAVAAHELLHVRRRDWALAVAEEAVRAALWFHPAVHWLLGRIRLCREQVVDRQVAGRLVDRSVYLEALLEVARGLVRARPLPATLMLGERHLKDRIELLLEEVNMSTRRIVVSLAAAAVALAASAAVAAWSFPLRPLAPADEPPIGDAAKGAPKRGPERKIVSKVNPAYPPEAKKDKVEGIVVLEVTVEKSGEVSKVSVAKGPEALREAAATAVRQWRYEPSDVGPILMTITVRFMLDKGKDKDAGKP